MKRDFLNLFDLSRDEILSVIERAKVLKSLRASGQIPRSLAGRVWAMLFEKDSLRTRVSFETGIALMGGTCIFIAGAEIKPGQREALEDIGRVLSGYVDGLVGRVYAHETLTTLAEWSSIPVVNGLSDQSHPCQLLADLMTIDERVGSLERIKAAWIGDGNNVAFSYIAAAIQLGFELTLACPEGYEPDPQVMARAETAGAAVRVVRDPKEAAAGAQVIATDVWTSMGQEAEREERLKAFAGYRVDAELLATAAEGAKVMHCLPAHRGEEITAEVIEGPQSIVFEQAENRLYAQMAILEMLSA